MELFGSFAPTWLIVCVGYLLGMFVVGFPMGYFSLRAWKHPERKFFSFWFFPSKTLFGKGFGEVGTPLMREGKHEDRTLMDILEISLADLSDETPAQIKKRATYVAITMFIWPLRILFNLVMMCVAVPLVTILLICNAHKPLVACLLRCKSCLRVS